MATITLEYDGRNKLMQDLIALLEKYGAKRKDVAKEEKPYNPEYVAMIKRSQKEAREGKYKTIRTEDLWK